MDVVLDVDVAVVLEIVLVYDVDAVCVTIVEVRVIWVRVVVEFESCTLVVPYTLVVLLLLLMFVVDVVENVVDVVENVVEVALRRCDDEVLEAVVLDDLVTVRVVVV